MVLQRYEYGVSGVPLWCLSAISIVLPLAWYYSRVVRVRVVSALCSSSGLPVWFQFMPALKSQ
jgi:hypothetical protein